jgi:Virulence factor SrfB
MKTFNEVILLVPDTGFRMFFFPLGPDPAGVLDAEVRQKIEVNRDACAAMSEVKFGDEGCPWAEKVNNYLTSAWQEAKEESDVSSRVKYCRYRFGVCRQGNDEVNGLWLAVETNLGTSNRGWLYDETLPSPEEESHFVANGQPREPYFASDDTSCHGDFTKVFTIEGRKLSLNFRWSDVLKATPVEVDLVIDFGNSRTAVLVLEHSKGKPGNFAQSCRPLSLKPSFYSLLSRQTRVDDAIVSSRFVLKSPEFRTFDPDYKSASSKPTALVGVRYKTHWTAPTFFSKMLGGAGKEKLDMVERLIPQMFVKLSPVCLGDDMEELVHGSTPLGAESERRMQLGELLQQSSAKRYFWDNEKSPQAWSCVPNYGDDIFGPINGLGRLSLLSGLMLRFQPEDGEIWGDGETLPCEWPVVRRPVTSPASPRYPRRNTLTWSVLAIMETAHRQINDSNWTQQTGAFHRRVIRNVIATYPSGWTSTEIAHYRAKWMEAIRIFQATNQPAGEEPIGLQMRMDEAVASQLPLIYASMQRLSGNNVGENWIAINGRSTPGQMPKLRVMNLDIGGGTSDVSIVEYEDKKQGVSVELDARVLFKDSSTVAGDRLVKAIIEKIILPKLAETPEQFAKFGEYFAGAKNVDETSGRVAVLTGSLLPLAVYLLSRRCSGSWTEGQLSFTPLEAGATNFAVLTEKLGLGQVDPSSKRIVVDVPEFDSQVEEVFGKFMRSLAKYASTYDVDMLMVCGKPSEQPAIAALIQRMVPVPAERILFSRGFKAGTWYPFKEGEDSAIADAKSVTCVGAALERAMSLQLIPGWKINVYNESGKRNLWGEMPKAGPRFSSQVLKQDQDISDEIIFSTGTRIGRKMFDANSCTPEPVYRLDWVDSHESIREVKAVFKRLEAKGTSLGESTDGLELVSVFDASSGEDLAGRVVLKLYPIGDQALHWQDTGMLEIFKSSHSR